MYDIRQFRPTLYILLALGITGFCLAARTPGLWVLSMLAIAGHHLLRSQLNMRAIPSWAAAIAALLFGFLTVQKFMSEPGSQLLVAGRFLVLLQLVKLFQEGTPDHRVENRNYTWLLVLSLLLMVAAAISTASLLFGLVFITYMVLSLYCCLLFHLKSETENARIAMTLPKNGPNPAVLRQDERLLPSSMRRLTALVSVCGLASAVFVFVFFPRGPGQGLFGQLSLRPTQALTGFSETVSFDSVARIQQSQEQVADVELRRDDELVKGSEPLYLRGITLDTYSGNASGGTPAGFPGPGNDGTFDYDVRTRVPWQWTRTPLSEPLGGTLTAGERVEMALPGQSTLTANVNLLPTGVNVVFAPAGVYAITFQRDLRFNFFRNDETLRVNDTVNTRLSYTTYSRGEVGFRPALGGTGLPYRTRTVIRSRIDPAITEFAKDPRVSGVDSAGVPLWQKRGSEPRPNRLDAAIAKNIETYLKENFAYTLDLTDTSRKADEDPIVKFLYDNKRGHCEYFAGAMTLLCQSLGIDARMVTGFKCNDYNALLSRYIVRQSDAHAWVEVRVTAGENWLSYDPTSSREAVESQAASLVTRLKRLMQYMEYTWADTVVSYDRDRRDNLLQNVERGLSATAVRTQQNVSNWQDWLPTPSDWWVDPRLVLGVITCIVLAGVGAVAYFMWERYKLRKRALRIGLQDLPDSQQLRLARQLGFYDDLLRLLEQRGHHRPVNLTPLEFSESLSHLPAEVYDSVHRLTRIYYRIRYGQSELAPDHQRRVRNVLSRIEPALGPSKSN